MCGVHAVAVGGVCVAAADLARDVAEDGSCSC